jgi:cobalt-precorrin 5A hydrolase
MRVIGLGLNAAATAAEVQAALAAAGSASLVATLATRADHPALSGLALSLCTLPEDALQGVETPTQSPRILARFGCGSVAEAAAIVASRGHIITPRQSLGAITWALAEGPGPSEGHSE